MSHEVVVVGGGIGGLTVAALLAARGVDVCLIEKESQAGGCVTNLEKFGYAFEPGMGLYSSWQAGEIHDRIFAELPVAIPEVRKLSPSYVVRLPDGTSVPVTEDPEEFESGLRIHFPECADKAIDFYKQLGTITPTAQASLADSSGLAATSARFRRFIDSQLQTFANGDSDTCSYMDAAAALSWLRRGLFAIRGGAAALAGSLAKAISKSGGKLRLDAPVLRLAYDSAGMARGVDLLSGEIVEATRAIISNLTVWDTYGKLVGMSKTPSEARTQLKGLTGWGAYMIFLAMEDAAALRLPADRILGVCDLQEGQTYDPEAAQFMLTASPDWDRRAPEGKRAATFSVVTEASQWFAFHEDESDLEQQDQAMLEAWWSRLHSLVPELGSDVEVIETMTPRDYYNNTRRKLGMVNGISRALSSSTPDGVGHKTTLANVFMVGDTTSSGFGVAAASQSGLIVANEIAPPRIR